MLEIKTNKDNSVRANTNSSKIKSSNEYKDKNTIHSKEKGVNKITDKNNKKSKLSNGQSQGQIKTGAKPSGQSEGQVKAKLYTASKITAKTGQGIKTLANTVQDIASQENPIDTTAKTVYYSVAGGVKVVKGTKKAVRTGYNLLTGKGFRPERKRGGAIRNVARKSWRGAKGLGKTIKTYANAINKEDTYDQAVAITKTTVNITTKPIQRKVKQGLKKLAWNIIKTTAKAIHKALQAVIKGFIELVSLTWPVLLIGLIVIFGVAGASSVFGGLTTSGSGAETEVEKIVDQTEEIFGKLQDKKDQELKNYIEQAKREVGKGQKPSKSVFAGISDEEYDKVIKEQWKENTVLEPSASFIDFRGLAVISQYFFENKTGELQKFIDKLDSQGKIETYDTIKNDVEYEVKWVKWTTQTVKGKTKKECLENAQTVDGKLKEIGEPAETVKGKEWSVEVKTGEKQTKKLTYVQAYIDIQNGVYTEWVDDLEKMDKLDDVDKGRVMSFMDYSYKEDGFMRPFDSRFDKAGGVASAGGQAVEGVVNGDLINFKGSIKDFGNTPFENAPSLYGQCTWFATGRWASTHKRYCPLGSNGGEMFTEAINSGMSVGKAPKPHSIICLGGGVGRYAGRGHVAFIEEIEMKDGEITSITISQGNIGAIEQNKLSANPMKYTDVRKFKNMDEYIAKYGYGLHLQGYIY